VALFHARNYEESIKIFLQAEKLAEIKDYTSISEEAGSLITSDNVKMYRGEDFEKVLINVYLALAFAAVGKLESAQVEARKINLILYKMITDGKRNYSESPFARYLSGLIWEAGGDWNAAYIDYKYPTAPLRERRPDRTELIVFFQRGFGPIKVPRDGQSSSLPRFVVRYSSEYGARVQVDGAERGEMISALNVESLSIQYLEERIGKMIAKKIAGAAVKGAIAAGVGSQSDSGDLGLLVFQLLMLADQADLRSWRSLPADVQMLRVPVAPGKRMVKVEVLGAGGSVVREIDVGEVDLRKNEKRFINVR